MSILEWSSKSGKGKIWEPPKLDSFDQVYHDAVLNKQLWEMGGWTYTNVSSEYRSTGVSKVEPRGSSEREALQLPIHAVHVAHSRNGSAAASILQWINHH